MKCYVSVNADFSEEGKLLPRFVRWRDGKIYRIDRVLDVRRAASLKVGGNGIRYRICVCGNETYLWYDDMECRWFVDEKARSTG